MFAYCANNAINKIDSCGNYPIGIGVDGEDISRTITHYGRKRFRSVDEAAKVAGNIESRATDRTNVEHANGIYYDPSCNNYYLGDTISGSHDSVSVNGISTENLVAISHSHPNCYGHAGEEFSMDDINLAFSFRCIVYLATPSGCLHKFTPCLCVKLENQFVLVISTELHKHKNKYRFCAPYVSE